MKKQFVKFLLTMMVLFNVSNSTHAQTRVYVKVRPAVTVVTRSAAPRRNYVWVNDEWVVRNGAYVNVPGHWVAPRRGFVWVPGHWITERRGDYWIPGYWRR